MQTKITRWCDFCYLSNCSIFFFKSVEMHPAPQLQLQDPQLHVDLIAIPSLNFFRFLFTFATIIKIPPKQII